MNIVPLALDRPIAFHRCFVNLTGSVSAAVFLSQAVYWQKRCQSPDGWWWKTQEDWTEETGLTRREQESARRACEKFILCRRSGIPAKLYFRVDFEIVQTRLAETAILACPKPPNRNGGNGQSIYTETSSETSSETTCTPDRGEMEAKAVEIYGQYPRKVAKRDAIRAIVGAIKRGTPYDALMDLTKTYCKATKSWPVGDRKYIPYPATWFNKEMFSDDPATWERAEESEKWSPPTPQDRALDDAMEKMRRIW